MTKLTRTRRITGTTCFAVSVPGWPEYRITGPDGGLIGWVTRQYQGPGRIYARYRVQSVRWINTGHPAEEAWTLAEAAQLLLEEATR